MPCISLCICVPVCLSATLSSSSLPEIIAKFFFSQRGKCRMLSAISPKSVENEWSQINFEDELKMIRCTFERQFTRIIIRRRVEECARARTVAPKHQNLSHWLCVLHHFSP